MSSFPPGSHPDFSRQDHHGTTAGSPLPADWLERARSGIEAMAEDRDETDAMRFAAERALFYLR